jgi:membrane protein DedA with SNARE-associated domain
VGVSWLASLTSALDFTEPLAAHLDDSLPLAYAVLWATTMPPLVPNSAILVTGGVLAAHGDLNIAAVLAVVALSAVCGDMLIHRGGAAMSGRVLHRFYRRPRRRALMEWASARLERHGVPFVIGCRFLPSGRVFGGLAAGVMGFPARRYLLGAATAETVWATYSVGIGYFGGQMISNSLYAVAIGITVSTAVAGLGGVAQWVTRRRDRLRNPVSVADHPLPGARSPHRPGPAGRTAAPGSASAPESATNPGDGAGPYPGTAPALTVPRPREHPPQERPSGERPPGERPPGERPPGLSCARTSRGRRRGAAEGAHRPW